MQLMMFVCSNRCSKRCSYLVSWNTSRRYSFVIVFRVQRYGISKFVCFQGATTWNIDINDQKYEYCFAATLVGLCVTRPRQIRNMAYRGPSAQDINDLRQWLCALEIPCHETVDFRTLDWNELQKKNRTLIKQHHAAGCHEGIKQCNSAKNLYESFFVPNNAKQSFEDENDERKRHQGYAAYREDVFKKVMKEDAAASTNAAGPGGAARVGKSSQKSNKMGSSQSSYASHNPQTDRHWAERGAELCAEWPHGCNIKTTMKKKGEERAKEYAFLYACEKHCRTCTEFLLCEVGVDINCQSDSKDAKKWAYVNKVASSQEKEDFIEFLETMETVRKWKE